MQFNRAAGHLPNRKRRAAASVTIELGKRHAGQL